jgi:hypothetical protein
MMSGGRVFEKNCSEVQPTVEYLATDGMNRLQLRQAISVVCCKALLKYALTNWLGF